MSRKWLWVLVITLASLLMRVSFPKIHTAVDVLFFIFLTVMTAFTVLNTLYKNGTVRDWGEGASTGLLHGLSLGVLFSCVAFVICTHAFSVAIAAVVGMIIGLLVGIMDE